MNNDPLEQQLLVATHRVPQGGLDDETRSLHEAYCSLAELLEASTEEVDAESLVDKVLAASPNRSTSRQDLLLSLLATAAAFLLLIPLASTQWESGGEVPQAEKTPLAAGEARSKHKSQGNEEVALAWNDDWDARMEQAEDLATAARWSSFTRLEATQWSVSEERRIMEAEWQSGSM